MLIKQFLEELTEEKVLALFGIKDSDSNVPLTALTELSSEEDDFFLVHDDRTGIVYTLSRDVDGYFPIPSELLSEIDEHSQV